MLNFLNSTVLFAAAAALIPLIIHLFSRRRVKIIEFSSLRHLKAMQRRQVRRLKIRQLLLLLLRMLIILVVVLAFARPTIRQGGVGTHASVSAVILFDNSASMNRDVADGNLFDIAKKRTNDLLTTFGQSDEVCLIPLDRSSTVDFTAGFTTPVVAGEQLARLPKGHGLADIDAALASALGLFSGAVNLNRELYLVTDRQRLSLPQKPMPDSVTLRTILVDLPLGDNDNRGVTALDFGGQLLQAGHDFNLTATIKNYGALPDSESIASLFLDGVRVAQTEFSIPPGGETTVRFTRRVSTTGHHSGYVEISDDPFPGDNRYFFSFTIPERFSVLMIDGDAATSFLKLALLPAEASVGYWSVKTAKPEQLSGVRFGDYNVIMLIGIPKLNQSQANRLQAYVRRGGSLLLTYGDHTELPYANAIWSPVSGVAFDKPVKQVFSRAGFYTLQSFATEHPIFSLFSLPDNRLPEIKFFTLPTVHLVGSPTTLMRFSGDRPALVENHYGSGKVLTLAGPIAPPYSDMVTHSFFVPLVSRLSEYLAADLSSLDTRLFCGENVIRQLNDRVPVTAPVQLSLPDSSTFQLSPQEERGTLVLKVAPVTQAGIYSVSYRGREIDRFAVNLNPAEGDLSAVDPPQLAAALGAKDFHLLAMDADPGPVLAQLRVGRELWPLLLWLAVLLLIAEMLLSRGQPAEE